MIEETTEEREIEITTINKIEITEEIKNGRMENMKIEEDRDQTEGRVETIQGLIQMIQAGQVHHITEKAGIEKTKKEDHIMDLTIHLLTINSRQMKLIIIIRMTKSDLYCIIYININIYIN
jgi:hypothetical protein